jgi:ribose transport system permease protein
MNMNKNQTLKKLIAWPPFPSFVLLIFFIVINIILGKIDGAFINSFINTNVALICLAIGVSVVIIGGGMDISLGAIVCLINVIFVTLNYDMKLSTGITIMVCIFISLLLGLINGFIVGILRVTPLLATFATTSVFSGLALWIKPVPGGSVSDKFIIWYNSSIAGIPVAIIFPAAVIIIWFIVKNSRLGVWVYSIGKDELKSYVSGIPVNWVKFFMYTFAGLSAGIGAIALTANVGAADPLVGLQLSMTCIAACVIGGISMSGGFGNILGSVFGSLFLGLVITTVLLMNINPYYQQFISGIIILIGVIGSVVIGRKAQKSLL